MDFKAATDALAGCVTHEELAAACGASVQAIRQARMDPSNTNYRNPPAGWESAVSKLARRRGGELIKLADRLDRQQS
jgi:hypothetical protein